MTARGADGASVVYPIAENVHRDGVLFTTTVPGPNVSAMQRLEDQAALDNQDYKRILRIAIVTARSAPAHERVVTTLKSWGVSADETFFLGGMEKARILSIFRPHLFFDDQLSHLKSPAGNIPMVHIPFGIANLAGGPAPKPA